MAKTFVVWVASASKDAASEIKNFLNARSEILDWIQSGPTLYFVQGDSETMEFGRAYSDYLRKNGHADPSGMLAADFSYLVIDIGSTSFRGSLPQIVWEKLEQWEDGIELLAPEVELKRLN